MNCCNHNCDQGRTCPERYRYPRTMREAFGPCTENRLEPMPDRRFSWGGLALGVLCLCFSIFLLEVMTKWA